MISQVQKASYWQKQKHLPKSSKHLRNYHGGWLLFLFLPYPKSPYNGVGRILRWPIPTFSTGTHPFPGKSVTVTGGGAGAKGICSCKYRPAGLKIGCLSEGACRHHMNPLTGILRSEAEDVRDWKRKKDPVHCCWLCDELVMGQETTEGTKDVCSLGPTNKQQANKRP